MDTLNLTTQWDKTFPKSDKSHHRKVTFHNHYGITLAVDLYTPVNASGKLPATPKPSENAENITPDEEKSIVLSVDGDTLDITWEKNESVDSLLNLLRSGDITVRTTRYGGFEQVGSLPQSLPRDDV